jgi:hypothetical protein
MRARQNAVALAATLLAAGALLPLPPHVRLFLAGLAIAVILVLAVVRMRAHSARRGAVRLDGVYGRIERIRAERAKRDRR